MKFMSENVSYAHNYETYCYVLNNATIFRDIFGDKEFTSSDYDKRTYYYNDDKQAWCHNCLSLKSAVNWGFVEVVREEPAHTKMELVYMTPTEKRICIASEYNKMNEEVISVIEGIYGKLVCKLVTVPCGNQKRYYYRWNEDNYQKWVEEGREMINRKVEAKIDSLTNSIELLKAMKI